MMGVPWSLAQTVSADFSTFVNFIAMVIVLFVAAITQVPHATVPRPLLYAKGRMAPD